MHAWEVYPYSHTIQRKSEIKESDFDLHTVEVVMTGSSWAQCNIYTCYCLTLDWMNVNIWVQDCCLLGKRAQKSISISEFGSCSEPCEEVKVIAVGKQEATPPPIPYTLLLQYQFTAPGEAQGISRVWCWWGVCFFITTCSGHSVCEKWCKARHADGTALR